MKAILSERNIVVVLFIMVLISFSLAQEETRKIERMYNGAASVTANRLLIVEQHELQPSHHIAE